MRRSSPRRLRTQPQPSMPLSTITAASASSHSTPPRSATALLRQTDCRQSVCVEGAPRWSPTPTRGSASNAADRERRLMGALGRQRAAAAQVALVGHARGSLSASPPRGTARTRKRCCAHRRSTCISCVAFIDVVAEPRPGVKNSTSGVTLGLAWLQSIDHRGRGPRPERFPKMAQCAETDLQRPPEHARPFAEEANITSVALTACAHGPPTSDS